MAGAPVGNQNAAKAKRWQKALERALARKAGDIDSGLDGVADKVVADALAGSKDAWKEIGDRIDGKAPQPIANADNEPFKVENIVRQIVDPAT